MKEMNQDTLAPKGKKLKHQWIPTSFHLHQCKKGIWISKWSNVHNKPIICVTVTIKEGNVYLVNTIDTSGCVHTANYLAEVAIKSIKMSEEDLKCKACSVVTDNAANVTKMDELLENDEDLNIITYGCSADILNLLANDLNIQNVTEHVLSTIWCSKLTLPSEVRWNTMVDCFETYLKGWGTLLQICEDHSDNINTA
ncbi:hypothetical protein PR048_008414 [Dryococelus australis]|uniref:DUF659 domain-containing protein n=1 Tax=Dryococelus australis TaxID=614101 RepID=A0ABQ9HX49_9NEOP|nr:hypothetical protein PR048_008414 [Dryococelus australis]